MAKKKRVLLLGDTHCGHRTGLTPPGLHRPASDNKLDQIAIELWDKFISIVSKIQPIDICIAMGDLIDGRENSTELIVGSRDEQAQMAAICLQHTKAKNFAVIKGTPFHVGKCEKFEEKTAEMVNAKSFGAHEFIDINGLVFDCKHKIGSSSIPHGIYTPIARDRLWSVLWADKGQPRSKIIVRAHTHEFNYCGNFDWLGFTTPGLQATSEYGVTNISRTIDWGMVYFDVWSEDKWTWKPEALSLELTKSQVVKF